MLLLDDVGGVCIILVCAHRVILVVLSFMPCASGFRGTFLHTVACSLEYASEGLANLRPRNGGPSYHASIAPLSAVVDINISSGFPV